MAYQYKLVNYVGSDGKFKFIEKIKTEIKLKGFGMKVD